MNKRRVVKPVHARCGTKVKAVQHAAHPWYYCENCDSVFHIRSAKRTKRRFFHCKLGQSKM